mgnify:FL=1
MYMNFVIDLIITVSSEQANLKPYKWLMIYTYIIYYIAKIVYF